MRREHKSEEPQLRETRLLMAKKKAMSLLQHNDRTEWELEDRLKRAGFSEDETEGALEYVRSFHYIDDERYAKRFVEIYHKSRSIQRIRQDLYKRHVPEEYIELALEEISWDDSEALRKELHKLLRRRGDMMMSDQEKQKIMAKLYRRGFQLGQIRNCMEEVERELTDSDSQSI